MTLGQVRNLLNAHVLSGENSLKREIEFANASDLMSDVLAFTDNGSLLLTGLTNTQVIRTCEIAGVCAVIFVRGKTPSIEIVKMAEISNIPVLATDLMMFDACGILYANGVKSAAKNKKDKSGNSVSRGI